MRGARGGEGRSVVGRREQCEGRLARVRVRVRVRARVRARVRVRVVGGGEQRERCLEQRLVRDRDIYTYGRRLEQRLESDDHPCELRLVRDRVRDGVGVGVGVRVAVGAGVGPPMRAEPAGAPPRISPVYLPCISRASPLYLELRLQARHVAQPRVNPRPHRPLPRVALGTRVVPRGLPPPVPRALPPPRLESVHAYGARVWARVWGESMGERGGARR